MQFVCIHMLMRMLWGTDSIRSLAEDNVWYRCFSSTTKLVTLLQE